MCDLTDWPLANIIATLTSSVCSAAIQGLRLAKWSTADHLGHNSRWNWRWPEARSPKWLDRRKIRVLCGQGSHKGQAYLVPAVRCCIGSQIPVWPARYAWACRKPLYTAGKCRSFPRCQLQCADKHGKSWHLDKSVKEQVSIEFFKRMPLRSTASSAAIAASASAVTTSRLADAASGGGAVRRSCPLWRLRHAGLPAGHARRGTAGSEQHGKMPANTVRKWGCVSCKLCVSSCSHGCR